jgi:hypothetical protein
VRITGQISCTSPKLASRVDIIVMIFQYGYNTAVEMGSFDYGTPTLSSPSKTLQETIP